MEVSPDEENSIQKTKQIPKDLQNENKINKLINKKEEQINSHNEIDENLNNSMKAQLENKKINDKDNSFFHSLRNDILDLRNIFHDLRSDFHDLRSDFHDLRSDFHDLRSDFHDLRSDFHDLRNDFHDLRNDFHSFRNDVNAISNKVGQNNNINYDELLEEKEIDEEIIEKYKDENCAICLENFNIGNKVCYLPCLHIYHSFCIKNWLKIKEKCPLCNNDLNTNNN